jgi:hypothetical protein
LGLTVLGVCSALLTASRAAAQCIDGAPSAGIELRCCRGEGRETTVVRADLAAADVGVRVSMPTERGLTPEAFAAAHPGVVVAVQGGPFAFPALTPLGLTIGEGTAWSDGRDDGVLGVLALDARGAGLVADARAVVPAEPWMHSAVSGVPVLVDGVPVTQCVGRACERAPRTAVGLSSDGRTLVIVAVRGWADGIPGVTDAELGELAREAGASRALRIGDGATSVLWVRSGPCAIPSSDGAARPVAALLALVDRGSGATSRIRGVVRDAASDAALPSARVRIATTDGVAVWEGGTLTDGAYWERTLPVREYLVQAELSGYRTGCKYCPTVAGADAWCSLFLERGTGAERCVVPDRRVEAGPWPLAPEQAPSTVDAGVVAPRRVGAGCAASSEPRRASGDCASCPGLGLPLQLVSVALLVAFRRRTRARKCRVPSRVHARRREASDA